MSSTKRIVIGFDLYGTLLSTESIAKELAAHFGDEKAKAVSALWRSMDVYRPFSEVTKASLKHALDESNVSLSDTDITQLMKAYDSLGTFPDVPPALESLADDSNIDAYVFSNGTNAMVSSSVERSPSLSSYASSFKGLITVDEVKAYKPVPSAYEHLAEKVGKKGDMSNLWLVSGNPFDVVGARHVGMQAAWVCRTGGHHGQGGWTDKLGDLAGAGPTIIVTGVDEAIQKIRRWTEKNDREGGT